MKLSFDRDAAAEYEAAVRYCAERDSAVARRFVAAINDALLRIRKAPTRWPLADHGTRRCLARRFPYAVIYVVRPGAVLVVAVMHLRRHPEYWHRRALAH